MATRDYGLYLIHPQRPGSDPPGATPAKFMKKQLYKLAQNLQPLMTGGAPSAVVRDAWSTLVRWHECGEPSHRLTDAEHELARAGLPLDLPLATAPIIAAGMLYIVRRSEWILVARHAALEQYRVADNCPPRAYTEPMLTYATESSDGLASGVINLRDAPTPALMRIYPGTYLGALGPRQLDRQEITPEITLNHPASSYGIPIILDDAGQPMDYAEGIKTLRSVKSLSTTELGALCNVSRRTVEGWEQGRPVDAAALNVMSRLL